MVHGGCASIGCYAMTDHGVAEIYAVVEGALKSGQKRVPVHIFPFRMTNERMTEGSPDKWQSFWRNLKTGYDLFEENGVPPVAGMRSKRYVFNGNVRSEGLIVGW